jgi:RNA polymerase Rpb1, domain 6
MDAQRIERQVFDSYGFTSNKFREVFFLDTTSDKFGQLNYTVSATNETAYYMHRNVVERCRNDVALRNLMEEEYEQLLRDREQLRYIAQHTQLFTIISSLTTSLLYCISLHHTRHSILSLCLISQHHITV